MKRKYFLKYQLGTVQTVEILADAVRIQDGCYTFVKEGDSSLTPIAYSSLIPIAYYPIMQTIIYKVEEVKQD